MSDGPAASENTIGRTWPRATARGANERGPARSSIAGAPRVSSDVSGLSLAPGRPSPRRRGAVCHIQPRRRGGEPPPLRGALTIPFPTRRSTLDPTYNRTGDIWHVWVEGITAGQLYAYRVDGPYNPREGERFNRHKLLLDPYATALSSQTSLGFPQGERLRHGLPLVDLSFSDQDNAGAVPRCIVTGNRFDWEEDTPPKTSWSETVIYETHVRGLTIHPSSGAKAPGTFRRRHRKDPLL